MPRGHRRLFLFGTPEPNLFHPSNPLSRLRISCSLRSIASAKGNVCTHYGPKKSPLMRASSPLPPRPATHLTTPAARRFRQIVPLGKRTSAGDSGRRSGGGSCGRGFVTSALGRLRAKTPGRHYDRSVGSNSPLHWGGRERVTPVPQ